MALNQILDRSASTVVVSGDTGALANGRDVVTITVTAIDTSGDPIPNAEVFIEETSGNHFLSDSEMPQDPGGDGRLRGPDPVETDANGVGAVTLTSFHEGTLTFDVFVGAPQGGTGGASGAAVFNGNNVDDGGVYTQKTLAADVGASGGYTTTYNTDQTIDAAWLVANNRGSTSIQNTRFQNCTVTVTTEVQFNNCLFEGGSNDYALVVNLDSVALTGSLPTNYLLQDCTITGGAEAGLTGYRIHMIDCLIEECGKHGIKLTKRSGTGNEPVQIVRSVVRKVGDGGSSVQPQGYGVYAVDARYVTLRGMSVECPYHTTGGAIAGYYPEGAVYVGADTEPISHFFFYTSWIDGGVKLDDAGLGIGPEGQMFSPNMYGRNYNPAVPLFDTTDVPSLWTKGQMWMDTGALISNEEAGGNIRTFTGKKYNNLWASGAALDTQATFTLDPAYSLVTLDAFDQFGPFTTNLLDFPPRNNKFNQWTPATINSSPVPTVLAETPLPFPQTGTADRISYNNSAAFADGALVRSKEVGINAGDTVPYEVTVAAANGDGFKTLMALKDDSDQITEQATVAFSNVFAENLMVSEPFIHDTSLGSFTVAPTQSATAAPDATLTAFTASNNADIQYVENFNTFGSPYGDQRLEKGHEYTWSIYLLAEADTRTHYLRIYEAISGTESCIAIFDIDTTDGVSVSSFSSVSTGPSYTSANAFRATRVAGTDWYRVSLRIADYSGAVNRFLIQFWYRYPFLNTETSFTYWKAELRYGNHITGQQLLTVDDGVENLLKAGSTDYTDFNNYGIPATATVAASPIAAPDGTLTAQVVDFNYGGSGTGDHVRVSGVVTSSDSYWITAGTWTASFYIHLPSSDLYGTFRSNLWCSGENRVPVYSYSGGNLSISSYSATTTGAEPRTAERDVSIEKIGETGWFKVSIVIHIFDSTVTSLNWWPIYSSNGDIYTLWNPTLRYGDWVSREKNRVTSGEDLLDPDWNVNTATVTRSDEVTPAGTSSAVLIVPDAGSSSMNDRRIAQAWETLGTAVGRVTLSAYFKDAGMGYAALCFSNNGGYHATATIDLSTGAATLGTHPTPGSDLSSSFEDVGDGWKFCSFTVTMQAGTNFMANACLSGSTAPGTSPYARNITGDGINGVHIWGARVTVGNPADARGYFVSGPQNLLGDGSDYTGGLWSKDASVTISANAQVAPNGRLEADDATRAVDADDFRAFPVVLGSAITGQFVRYTFYVKPPSGLGAPSELLEFYLADDPFTTIYERVFAYFDYSTPAVPVCTSISSLTTGGPGYTVDDVTITPISNGWSRIQIDLFDYSGNAGRVIVRHFGRNAANSGSAYTVSYWGSEITTIDRTPTATDLRPISGGIVDFDAYPAEHRSLFGSYTDLGDNQYRVGITLTDDTSSADYARIEHYQANSAETTHQIYLSSPSVDDIDLDLLAAVLINPPKPGGPFFDIPLITHAVHELGNDGRVPTTVATFGYYAGHLGWWDTEGAVVEKEPQPYGGDKITVIVPPVRGNGSTP